MSGRRRALILAALALAVPLPALALTGGSGSGLAVSASLNGCGVAGGSIVCGIDTSFSGVAEARYITASVTAPDGSVTDFGTVAHGSSGSATLWVPYTGNGTYTVSASAWGLDDAGEPEVIETDEANAGGEGRIKELPGAAGGPREVPGEPVEGDEPAAEEPVPSAPEPELPPCEPAPVPPAPTEPPAPGDTAEPGVPAPEAVEPASTESAPTTEATTPTDCAPPDATAPPAP